MTNEEVANLLRDLVTGLERCDTGCVCLGHRSFFFAMHTMLERSVDAGLREALLDHHRPWCPLFKVQT